MWNLDNSYIWGPRFVMGRTDAQNRVDIIFKSNGQWNVINAKAKKI